MFFIPMFAIMLIGSVMATAYVVNSFVITVDVNEPFVDVEYVIIGDAGNWDGETGCDADGLAWNAMGDIDVQGLFAGESRNICVRFHNNAEAEIHYTLSSVVLNTNIEIKEKCQLAFPEVTKSGDAPSSGDVVRGKSLTIAQNADTVNDCRIQIAVARG